jgi:DNA-binding transcriptional ArsR family regulator
MPNYSRLDPVFRALAHPTRRAVVERLGRGPAATTELARPFRMALPSFLEHMKILEACGLVRSGKSGRVRVWRLTPVRLQAAEGWLSAQRAIWERRLDQLDDYLIHEMQDESTS